MLTVPVWFEITGTILSVLFNAAMVAIAVASAYYAYKAYRHQKDRSKMDAACKLAKYYASDVIGKYSHISSVFKASGLYDEIKRVFDLRSLNDFDREELTKLLNSQQIRFEDFAKKMVDIDAGAILQSCVNNAQSVVERELIVQGYTKVDKDGNRQIVNESYLKNDFMQEIGDLLNGLEWFAMNCRAGLADETLLYQSLHQTYISTVWMLYFFISSRNINNEDKLFTNVIWLFTEWRNRLNEITDKHRAQKEALLEKAKAVKAEVFTGSRLE